MTTTADAAETTDALVQATSGSLAVLSIDLIHPHPKNIRHDAVADPELVESIRTQGLLQPLVVAPLYDGSAEVKYRLIAGHRRLDGIKQAGGDHATVIIRRDLTDEADQVAAMLVENGRRRNLTPMEEAEGYGQLRFDFGWKPGAIAKAAGPTVDTVNKRLRLLKLDKKVQKTLDDGQLSIDDALTITALPAADQKKVAHHAGTPSFKWELSKIKERIATQAKTDKTVAKLAEQGIPRRDLPKGKNGTWGLTHTDDGMTPLSQTFSRDPDQHPDCLAFVLTKDYRGAEEISYVCTDVPSHDEQLDEDRKQQRLEEEKAERERRELEEAEAIARNLRVDAILDSLKPGAKHDPALVAVLRAVTPYLVSQLDDCSLRQYATVMDIADEDLWAERAYGRKAADVEKFEKHIDPILTGKPHRLVRAFVAATAARMEGWVVANIHYRAHGSSAWERMQGPDVLAWLQLAESAGHALTPVEDELRATILGDNADEGGESA